MSFYGRLGILWPNTNRDSMGIPVPRGTERGNGRLQGYILPNEVNKLRARLRKNEDRDIKEGLCRLGKLEQGELSDMIRNGIRHELQKKGVLKVDD